MKAKGELQNEEDIIKSVEENFFKHVSQDDDIDLIMARGERNMAADDAPYHGSGVKIEPVELESGKSYAFKTNDGEFKFVVEAGGIIAGDNINGSIQSGRVLFRAGDKDYEGQFFSATAVNVTWKDGSGKTGSEQITLHPK